MKWSLLIAAIHFLIACVVAIGVLAARLHNDSLEAIDWLWLAIAAALLVSAVGIALHLAWGRALGILMAAVLSVAFLIGIYLTRDAQPTGMNSPRDYFTLFDALLACELFALVVLIFAWPGQPNTE